jgi:hypothetical protein
MKAGHRSETVALPIDRVVDLSDPHDREIAELILATPGARASFEPLGHGLGRVRLRPGGAAKLANHRRRVSRA